MTIDSALTKNVIKVTCLLSRINEIMKRLISVNIEFTKVTLFKNALWHVHNFTERIKGRGGSGPPTNSF